MVPFGGWDMPLQFEGILREHLATRKGAGLFDVSHMGRCFIRCDDALAFLQHALSNNAAALDVGLGQYTMLPNETGGVHDDAYLYRFVEDEFLLVVNAANREKDWDHLQAVREHCRRAETRPFRQLSELRGAPARLELLRDTGQAGVYVPLVRGTTVCVPHRLQRSSISDVAAA